MERASDATFPLVLDLWIATFGGRESDSGSESEESSEEDDSEAGFFTTGFGADFDLGGLAA